MAALSGETDSMETMETKGKKMRKSNFSASEIAILTEKVEQNLDILQSKFTNTITNQKKTKIWLEVTEAVNALGIEKRTAKEIKDKWKNLSSVAKKEYCLFKKASKETGGGPPPKAPSDVSSKIIEIYGDTPQFNGLEGFESELIEKYGEGEVFIKSCPRCSHPVEVTTEGVHFGKSQRIYTDVDPFECPKCFYREDAQSADLGEDGVLAASPKDSAEVNIQQQEALLILQVEDDKLKAVLNDATASKDTKRRKITQQDVMREQFNALKEKQINQKLKQKKLELEIKYLEKKLQKDH